MSGGKLVLLAGLLATLSACGPGASVSTPAGTDPPPQASDVVPTSQWENFRIFTYNWNPPQTSNLLGGYGPFPWTLSNYPPGGGFQANGGGLWFNFPSYDSVADALAGQQVIRLLCFYGNQPYTGPDAGGTATVPQAFPNGTTLTATFSIQQTGNPTWVYNADPENTCAGQPQVFLFFSESYTGTFQPYYEWWSVPKVTLGAPGQYTLTVPFQTTQWIDMNGNPATAFPDAFQVARSNVSTAGLSFGGGCFDGHGQSVVGGTAQLELVRWAVQ